MSAIDILVPGNAPCRWHAALAERLSRLGHDVALVDAGAPPSGTDVLLERLCRLERKALRKRRPGLLDPVPEPRLSPARPEAALRLDLTGSGTAQAAPTLVPLFSGCLSPAEAARMLMLGQLPGIDILLDGAGPVAHAEPMPDSRLSVSDGIGNVLAGAITLLASTAQRCLDGRVPGEGRPAVPRRDPTGGQLIGACLGSMLPRQLGSAIRRMFVDIHHWDVRYRFHKGTRVADSGSLAGEPWIVLPDDGRRFYADPFLFAWQGRHFIFMEDFPKGAGKAVISAAEVLADGTAIVPRCVLDEPHHLSYPQVFARDGEIWMLPEGGAGGELVLYRAESFPDRWVRHAVLIPDRELFDATLLEQDGRLWLFATERYGHGSASDTLVVFHAPALEGPWSPHPANPVTIDRATARPGGAFVRSGGRILLPLQDGTAVYGGGLGLAELVELSTTTVRLAPPAPILAADSASPARIHTLNVCGPLETIDSLAPLPRARRRRAGRPRGPEETV